MPIPTAAGTLNSLTSISPTEELRGERVAVERFWSTTTASVRVEVSQVTTGIGNYGYRWDYLRKEKPTFKKLEDIE